MIFPQFGPTSVKMPTMLSVYSFLVLFVICSGAKTAFKRELGKLDYLYAAKDLLNDAHSPFQLAPIYAHECMEDECQKRRFHSVRFGSGPIIEFSNLWTTAVNYIPTGYYIRCPRGMLVSGLSCIKGDCTKPQLHCGKVLASFGSTANKFKIVLPSNTSRFTKCPDSMYVSGLQCTTWHCIPTGLHCTRLLLQRRPKMKHLLERSGNRVIESALFTDKNGGKSEKANGPIFQIRCIGSLCNPQWFFSIARGVDPLLGAVQKWTPGIQNAGSSASCPTAMVVAQMHCQAPLCNKVALGCAKFLNSDITIVEEHDTRHSEIFGPYDKLIGVCPDGYYFKKLHCIRDLCYEMVMECVKITFIE